MIEFCNITKRYGDSTILQSLNLKIETGEFAVLIGPSGCGKTTTLKIINRLIEPESGSVLIDGQDIFQMDKVQLRRSIGYVIQQIGLFPNMTVEQNISVVPRLLKYSKDKTQQIAKDMLALVEMPYEEFAHKYPSELSGGQQQRIGVLRALAASPPIVLMDEPFGALDPMTRAVLQEEVSKLQKKLNKTIVFVTHDMDEALNMADKVIFMERGRIVQMAEPDEFLRSPATDLIRSFMGKRTANSEAAPQTAADFMRTNVIAVRPNKGLQEAVDMMARRGVDTLLIKEQDDTYVGTISVKDIKKAGSGHRTVQELVNTANAVSYTDEDAQVCFEKLLSGNDNYVVVLNHDNTVAGIVTKTSMARSFAAAFWGNGQ